MPVRSLADAPAVVDEHGPTRSARYSAYFALSTRHNDVPSVGEKNDHANGKGVPRQLRGSPLVTAKVTDMKSFEMLTYGWAG